MKLGEGVKQPHSSQLRFLGDKTFLPPGVSKAQFDVLVRVSITALRVVFKKNSLNGLD